MSKLSMIITALCNLTYITPRSKQGYFTHKLCTTLLVLEYDLALEVRFEVALMNFQMNLFNYYSPKCKIGKDLHQHTIPLSKSQNNLLSYTHCKTCYRIKPWPELDVAINWLSYPYWEIQNKNFLYFAQSGINIKHMATMNSNVTSHH